VVAGAALLGVDHAVAAGVAGALVLLNLWVLSVLGPRVVRSLARGEPPTLWVAAIGAKFVLFVGAFVLLLKALPPLGIALGFVPLLAGTLITGIWLAAQDEDSPEAEPGDWDRSAADWKGEG
jgi:hypothetical protein